MLEIYTDGSCSGNPGPGGWGYRFLIDGMFGGEQSGSSPSATSNSMELTAIIQSLTMLQDIIPNHREVIVYSDSAYCVNGLNEWVWNWEANGWITSTKSKVKNKELWEIIQLFRKKFRMITFLKVKGHADNEHNNAVDKLAREAVKREFTGKLSY